MGRGGIVWGAGDLTGGPVDEIFGALRARFTDLWIERLRVTHPADSDNLWFVGRHGSDEGRQMRHLGAVRSAGRAPAPKESR